MNETILEQAAAAILLNESISSKENSLTQNHAFIMEQNFRLNYPALRKFKFGFNKKGILFTPCTIFILNSNTLLL